MTLLDRYLRAVAAQLPKDTREDIVAELRDLILNRFEAREAELGRTLSEAEQEAIIREMGHPLAVAGRYRNGPSHLVGPELYPYWLFAVKVGLAVMAAITLLGALVQLAVGELTLSQMLGRVIGNLIQGGITLVGAATIAGFILERQARKPRFLTEWRVQDLALFELVGFDTETLERTLKTGVAAGAWTGAPRRRRPSPVASAIGSLAGFAVLLLWWTGLLPIIDLRPGAGVWVFDGVDYGAILTAIIDVAFWPVLAYLAACIAVELFRAWRPGARRLSALAQLLLSGARLAGILWLWTASPLAPVVQVESLAGVRAAFQRLFFDGGFDLPAMLTVIGVAMIIEAVLAAAGALWRLATPAPRDEAGVAA
jgi:hypothetical protein